MTASEQSVSIVTGSSGALGSEIVRFLVAKGQRVAAIDRKPTDQPQAATLKLAIDTSALDDWSTALGRVERELGTVTGAVLVAGAWRGGARFFEAQADSHWNAMLSANLETARTALRALLPGMVSNKRGSVVLIGSRAALRPWESARSAAYAASKAAVVALASSLAAEVLDDGVRVNVVLPSTIDTPANRESMPNAEVARWVSPASLAGVVEFLLSPAARDISGAAIPVYGRVGV